MVSIKHFCTYLFGSIKFESKHKMITINFKSKSPNYTTTSLFDCSILALETPRYRI